MSGGKSVERLPAEVLDEAVERIIRHCQSLDRDRTELARALSRVQDELVLVREENGKLVAENARLLERQGQLECSVQAAVVRLERIADVCEQGSVWPAPEPFVCAEPGVRLDRTAEEYPDGQGCASGTGAGERVVKALDLSSFTRIVRQAGGVIEPEPVSEASEIQDSPADVRPALESSECIRDRLF